MRTVCNNCGYRFEIGTKTKRIAQNKEHGRVEKTYFTCPKCKHEYIVIMTDNKSRALIRQRKDLLKRRNTAVKKRALPQVIDALYKKGEELEIEIKAESEALKKIYG